jgi:RimJ/RimL family protein N-acetyltransferase
VRESLNVVIVRPMTEDDLPAIIDLQQAGATAALAAVFPQDRYPFPRDVIVDRWRQEICDPEIETFVAVDDRGQLVGFAAITGSELLHFGTAIDTWGGGTASDLHALVICRLRVRSGEPVLFVFADNGRARRFYEKHGWQPTGATRTGSFPPYPLLLEYTLPAS